VQIQVLWRALLRRWYAAALALVLAVVGTLLVVDEVGPTYESTGAVLVLPPETTLVQADQKQTNTNPFLALGSLSQVRDVAIRALTSQSTQAEMCASTDPAFASVRQGLCGEDPTVVFDVGPDYTNSAPIILIKVDADSVEASQAALKAIMDQVPVALAQLQAPMKLKADATILSAPLVADAKPEVVRKNQIRVGIVTGAGILGLGLMVVALLDHLLLSAAARRPRPAEDEDAATDEVDGWWAGDAEVSAIDREAQALSREVEVGWGSDPRQVEPVGRG
jgi:hypothetical protein